MIVNLFEAIETSEATMAPTLQEFFDKFFLMERIIAYLKNEGFNLQSCAIALNSMVSCKSLNMLKCFHGFYFGHTLSKV